MKVAFLGRPDIDHYFSCENLPELGDKAFVSETNLHLGGMVTNAAVIGEKLGAVCSLVYSISRYEDTSNFILKELEYFHVATEHLTRSERKNTKCMIITSKGERIIYVVKNDTYPLVHISKKQETHLLTRDFVYTTIADLGLIENLEPLCQNILQYPVRLFIDCDNLINDEHLDLLQYADIASVNQFGFQKLNELGYSAIELQKRYKLEYLLITHGAKGATLYCSDGRILEQTAFSVDAIDTTGAGDSFNMSFIYALHCQLPVEKSLELAAAVGAYSTKQCGTHFEIDLKNIVKDFHLSEDFLDNFSNEKNQA